MSIKQENPDFVITYTINPNIYGGIACKKMKVPYAQNITGLGLAFQKKGILQKLVSRLYKSGTKNAKVVFFENSENRDFFVKNGMVREEQTCLLNGSGVNLNHF